MASNSISNVLAVTISLCVVCSVAVSTTAVVLRPYHNANEALFAKKREILKVAGLYQNDAQIEDLYKHVDARIIELATGRTVDTVTENNFNYKQASKDPDLRVEIPLETDIAKIHSKSAMAPVYFLKSEKNEDLVVFPIYGSGLWSTIYAYIALKNNASVIAGISFYQHGETPGLGAEISNPNWLKKWQDKHVFDENGKVKLRFRVGGTSTSNQEQFEIDAISGATVTTNGVLNLIQFWLGDQGYGPFLNNYRQGKNI